MSDLNDGEAFGKRLADATRRIAFEVSDTIRKDALERLAEAAGLNEQTVEMIDDLKEALDEADLPKVLALLQAQRDHAATMETSSLQRETKLLERDQKAQYLLDDLKELIAHAEILQQGVAAKAAELDAWQADTSAALGDARTDVAATATHAAQTIDALSEAVTAHKSDQSALLTLGMDLWQREIDQALSKATEAVGKADVSRETLQEERRSLAASRAHVTKALTGLEERAAALFEAITQKADDHIAKREALLDKLEAPPPSPDPAPAPQGALQWAGPYAPGKRYRVGEVVMHLGSSWVAVSSSRGREPAVVPGNPWQLFAAAGMSGGGFTSQQARLGLNTKPEAFYQDTPPKAGPSNWDHAGYLGHVRQWFDTTTYKQFIAVTDANGDWLWAEVTSK